MTRPFIPADQDTRCRIRDRLDENLLVEAGAGTGKTTSLVERMVNLIITGRATLDRVAAITFTEAAAAELRDRVREALERATADSSLAERERQHCRQGVRDLGQAAIQTLHSFAGSLLRERPLEAGLPPSFETMDEIQADLLFQEAWEGWLNVALDDTALAPHLSVALTLGLSLGHLRGAAQDFHEDYDLLEGVDFPDTSAVQPRAGAALKEAAPELERLCAFARRGDQDPLLSHVQTVLSLARRLQRVEPGSLAEYRLLYDSPSIKTRNGKQGDWDKDPRTGQNACKTVKDLLSELYDIAQEELEAVRRASLMPLLRALQDFVLDYARERKGRGVAGFQDLLVWARDLLRDNLAVRDYFRRRYTHLLIDEFQDTDPLQAEIALFLAEDAPHDAPGESRPRRWREARPAAGKLFVVGDSKQSIYRFRRADITLAAHLRLMLGQESLHLTQNFRSQRPVIEWVNYLFGCWMEESPGQPAYTPLTHCWDSETGHASPPAVRSLGQALKVTGIEELRRLESHHIASLLHRIRQEGWLVLDREVTRQAGEECFRPARYKDICLLLPRRTSLPALELALEESGAPYRLESASLVFETQEARDLLNCLRAVDNPADQVALVAALRSPALACSDVDLLAFVEGRGCLDYLLPENGPPGPVAQGLRVLKDYHDRRLWTSPAALIEGFIRERRLMELALDYSRPRERWRRYHFLVEQARAFAQAGGASLRAFLDWVERQEEEGARMVESPMPEGDEDAVRVMTIHAAKGLEFPIVLLTGLNSARPPRNEKVIFDRESGRVEARLGPSEACFQTLGYPELLEQEKERGAEEDIRLMYVAATRARDHLILSLYRADKDKSSLAAQIAQRLDGQEHLWRQVPEDKLSPFPGPDAPGFDQTLEEDTPEARQRWQEERKRLLRDQGRPAAVAATTLAQEAKDEQDSPEEPWRRGRGGTSLGRAVHAVLQTVDLATGEGLAEIARAQAAAEGIPRREREVLALVQRALTSQVVERAVASGRWWREVPVAAPVHDGVLEGFIDLLFEEDGQLVVVDYKTDALEREDEIARAMQRYRLQGGAYALALQKAAGLAVKEVVFLFLQPHQQVSLTDVDALTREAEQAAAAFIGNPIIS